MSRNTAEVMGILLALTGFAALCVGVGCWSIPAAAALGGTIALIMGLAVIAGANRSAER